MRTHTRDQVLHFNPATVHEADLLPGRSLDLTVQYVACVADMALFERAVVFGLKGLLTGY